MIYSPIPGVDQPVSRMVMGSMVYSRRDVATAGAMLDHFVSLGGNAIDTAHVYGGGEAERAVGEWMRLRGNRAEIVIVGKGAAPDGRGPRRVTRADIDADLAESLERLGTDYIDLYLLHRDDPDVPVGELVESLNGHHRAGRIRAFGGSNWSTVRLQEANDYAQAHALIPFAASSPNFSLATMNEPPWAGCVSATVDGTEWYIARQFPLLAWSSQAQGFFTGRYVPDDHTASEMVRCWYSTENFERLERARRLRGYLGECGSAGLCAAPAVPHLRPDRATHDRGNQQLSRSSERQLDGGGFTLADRRVTWAHLKIVSELSPPSCCARAWH